MPSLWYKFYAHPYSNRVCRCCSCPNRQKKTDVILALREVTTREPTIQMLDLATAKRLTDAPPCVVIPNLSLEVGERVKARLEKAGAIVELKPA
jgi:ribosomal protein L7/L12